MHRQHHYGHTLSSHSQRQVCSWAAKITCKPSPTTNANSIPSATVISAAEHSRRTRLVAGEADAYHQYCGVDQGADPLAHSPFRGKQISESVPQDGEPGSIEVPEGPNPVSDRIIRPRARTAATMTAERGLRDAQGPE